MDVAITDLRANLSEWLARVGEGTEVVVTDRGVPVARLMGVDSTATLVRLTEEGAIGRPKSAWRPTAKGRKRPRPSGSVADQVTEQRR